MKLTKRSCKNIIMVLIIAILAIGTYGTINYAQEQFPNSAPSMTMQTPPDGSSFPGIPPQGNNTDSSDSNSNQSPSLPDGESFDGSQPSERPDTDSFDSNGNQPPSLPDNGDNNGFPGAPSKAKSALSTGYYIALGAESTAIALLLIYLILSGFNKKTFKETFNHPTRVIIWLLAATIIAGCLTVTEGSLASRQIPSAPGMSMSADNASADAAGATTVDGEEMTLSETYAATESDESAILVTNGGNATISGATVTKSGDSSNTENSEFYGVNAGVLVQSGSEATITDATISTDATGANAVFATGENAKITVKNTTITTTGASSARGLDATYGGTIEADNVNITTQGGSCATLATDRGEGTVTVTNSTLETGGKGSPVIYSTGNISIDNTKGTANGSQMAVIEGKNSATVTNSTLTASGAGNRNGVDNAGIMIYQSMSGDAGEGTGTFTATDSSLSLQKDSDYYKTAPMFFVTNTDAVINLTNTQLDFGSGVLLNAAATDEWGNSGSNGGNVTLNAENQMLNGNITADSISTVSINLTKSSFEGTINGDNSAKEISLTLDAASTITLTGDTYVTSLTDADSNYSNINFNGYTLYVNNTAIND